MMARKPLWKVMVERGLVEDRREAEGWTMMGRVLVDGDRVDKSGHAVPEGARIVVKGLDRKYVSRGGLKLEGALEDFGIDVSGRVALDCGASKGGFTDCLLQYGAGLVYAVDAGYGQLAGKLRVDERVVNMERTNISDLEPGDLDPRPELSVVDLSYLSLRKAIPIVCPLLEEGGELACLVKPLFEVTDGELARRGAIEDADVFREVLRRLIDDLRDDGHTICDLTASPVTGSGGTGEFFLHIRCGDRGRYDPSARIPDVVRQVMELKES